MLIRGDRLNDRQRALVLAAFVHRPKPWTRDKDDEYLKGLAFYFVKNGSRLSGNKRFAVPAVFADLEEKGRRNAGR